MSAVNCRKKKKQKKEKILIINTSVEIPDIWTVFFQKVIGASMTASTKVHFTYRAIILLKFHIFFVLNLKNW